MGKKQEAFQSYREAVRRAPDNHAFRQDQKRLEGQHGVLK
jgi:hypothetical protein